MHDKKLNAGSFSWFRAIERLPVFFRLYPSASIPVDTKKGFEAHARKKVCARIATGDRDVVIIGHSRFERIPISRERLLNGQADEITEGITEVKAPSCERFAVKQPERAKKSPAGAAGKTSGLQAATFGDSSKPAVGQQVFAIGNSLDTEFFGTLTGGYVSAIDRPISGLI